MSIEEKISAALAALQQGKPVIVLDDASRENEADVILSAATATEKWVAWTIRHSSGVLCVPLTNQRADELEIGRAACRESGGAGGVRVQEEGARAAAGGR